MKFFVIFAFMTASTMSLAAEKFDWKACGKEIQEFCTSSNGDKEKHECLEEAPQSKLSKACKELNEKAEEKLGHKHDGAHSH